MRNHFLLEEIIFEGRLDDLKKKYNEIPVEVIEKLSKEDPSGNNKYLEFLLQNYSERSASWNTNMVNIIKDFHKNLQKIDTNILDNVYREDRLTNYLEPSETSPVGKTIKKIYKAPKDINSYMGVGGISILEKIVKASKEKLSKSEVKELEANILYDSPDLKILIPESYRASCYYGTGTKWCTTNKESDYHFKSYTGKGTLFYVINKKEPQSNPWYRTAIFVNKNDGTVQAFDAPDNPTQISVASKNLGDKWPIIKDTIVDYLYKINSKGIDSFYSGNELLTWYKSKGVDPLRVLNPRDLAQRVGIENLNNYLKEVGVDPYSFFDFDDLMSLFSHSRPNVSDYSEIVAEIWEGYKKAGINPLLSMFNIRRRADFVIDAIKEGKISLDDFLNLFNDPVFLDVHGENQNLFSVLTQLYSGGSWTGSSTYQKLMRIFNDDIDLVWGYAKNFDINIFTDLDSKTIFGLLKRRFKPEEALEYVFKNLGSVQDKLINLGFSNENVLNYVNKSKDKEKLLNYLLSNKLLNKLKIEDYISLGSQPKEAFLNYLESKASDGDEAQYYVNTILEDEETETIKKVFKDYQDFNSFIKNNIGNIEINKKTIWRVFYDKDYYKMYSDFLELGREKELGDIFLIDAYNDAPVSDKSGLKEKVLTLVEEKLKGNPMNLYLERKGDTFYVFTEYINQLGDFFEKADDAYYVLTLDTKNINIYVEGEYSNLLDEKEVRDIVNEYLMLYRNKKIVMDLEFVDDFDYWAEKINEVDNTFSFVLYDERIYGMEPYLMEILIKNAPIFSDLNKLFKKTYDYVYKSTLVEYVRDVVVSEIENIFGSDFGRQRTIIVDKKEKSGIQFKYDFIMDDIIAFANNVSSFENDTLPKSVKYLITELMEESAGRFKDGYNNLNIEYLLESHSPREKEIIQNFVKVLEKKLLKME